MNKKILLVDGYSILFRAFYGMPLSMTTPDGVHTNAVYGFLAILRKVIEEEKPDYIAVAFDKKAPTFRHKMYEAYKGNRQAAPPEFHETISSARCRERLSRKASTFLSYPETAIFCRSRLTEPRSSSRRHPRDRRHMSIIMPKTSTIPSVLLRLSSSI